MNEVRIPYRPNKTTFILSIAFFVICTVAMGAVSLTNVNGLILFRLIDFTPREATLFYWAITVSALAITLFGLYGLIRGSSSQREIVITENSLTSPKSNFSKHYSAIDFSDITRIDIQIIYGNRILNIEHAGGKLSIPNSMLPNRASFEELVSQLMDRTHL